MEGRLSKFQRAILGELKNGKLDYEDLRESVMEGLKISWDKEESFKASFSRSLKNLAEKQLIKRSEGGCYLGRLSLLYESIKLTEKGLQVITN